MARQLWLLRHAEAEPHGTRADQDRRLTPRGEEQARAAGLALRRLGLRFEEILYSPKERARRTAELAAECFTSPQRKRMREYEPLAAGIDVSQALKLLPATAGDARLLLVGHEPDLSRLAGDLTGGRVDLKKGGVAALRLEGSAAGELVLVMRPRELAAIAGVPADGE
jgi:phosphohistidine phosphatase